MDAEVSVVQYEGKLRKLLENFLDKDFDIKDDVHFNLLLTQLSDKIDQKSGKLLIEWDFFSEWLLKAVQKWEETKVLPSVTITAITIHIASLLVKDERRFVYFNSCNLLVRMCSVLKLRKNECSSSVRLAYIKLLSSFLEHKSGVEWLIGTDNWQDVLDCCLNGRTIYIIRESKNFIYSLLLKSTEVNMVYTNMLLEKIMNPLVFLKPPEKNLGFSNSVEQYKKLLISSLRLISFVLQTCLESELFAKRDYRIPCLFIKNYMLEDILWNVSWQSFNYNELCVINNAILLCFFFDLAIDSVSEVFSEEHLKNLIMKIYKLINWNINKKSLSNLLELNYLFYYYLRKIDCHMPKGDGGTEDILCRIETQFMCYQFCPLMVYSMREFQLVLDDALAVDGFREIYSTKLMKFVCPDTIRMAYILRDALLLLTPNELFNYTHKTVVYMVKSIPYLNKSIAVIAFQSMTHVLQDVLRHLKKKQPLQVPVCHSIFVEEIADAEAIFIKKFNITWRESLETICILSNSMDLLTSARWPEKTVTKLLKLINISIEKFMPPNLALLVDRTKDSSMANLGTMLIEKLCNPDWEVRDSALEVLFTISTIAHSMFPSFQEIVLDSDLPSLMVSMCQHDCERYVRASAIKCLQEMIKVPKFWKGNLDQQDLPEKMINILYKDTEANVRMEAATLICEIYEHQSIPEAMLKKVNEAMAYAAANDLHWEVKLNALSYWQKMINNRLANQGMIDGSFPSVTFSKDNRKIVTLTGTEIQNALNKVLWELSNCGCLGVLLMTIQDDSDIVVAKRAVKITEEFADLLKLHSVTGTGTCNTPTSPKLFTNPPNFTKDIPMTTRSDEVINSIVKCRDVNLLSKMCINDEVQNETLEDEIPLRIKIVNPKEFINFIHKNLNNLTDEKERWMSDLDDLDSLLDDILKNYDSCDANAMDCY